MKFLAKIISFFGVLASILYLIQKAIAKMYDETFHSHKIYKED